MQKPEAEILGPDGDPGKQAEEVKNRRRNSRDSMKEFQRSTLGGMAIAEFCTKKSFSKNPKDELSRTTLTTAFPIKKKSWLTNELRTAELAKESGISEISRDSPKKRAIVPRNSSNILGPESVKKAAFGIDYAFVSLAKKLQLEVLKGSAIREGTVIDINANGLVNSQRAANDGNVYFGTKALYVLSPKSNREITSSTTT